MVMEMVEVKERGIGKMKISLMIGAVLVVALVVSNIWFYVTLQNQIDALNSEINSLNTTYANYVATHNVTDSQYNALKAPKLSALSIYSEDVTSESHLHVTGELWNVGTDTAYECRLRVQAYQGDVIAINTYISIGTIEGENRRILDYRVGYSGSPLTRWTMTPQWETKPEFPTNP